MFRNRKQSAFVEEFKKFIFRGNIVDMAVGVIVGGAFTAVVNGLSDFVLKPIINWVLALIIGSSSLDGVYTYLKKVEVDTEVINEAGETVVTKTIDLAQSIYIDWGSFINSIINFLLVAFTLFVIIKTINRIRERTEQLKERLAKLEEEKEAE